jgi:hypothetical protein
MKQFIFLSFIFFTTAPCSAQQNESIFGKWKVFAVIDDEFYHHFDKDSTVLSANFKLSLAESKKDTLEAISVVKFSMRVFENAYFNFKKDSTYETSCRFFTKENINL